MADDRFGVKMIYESIEGGEEYYIQDGNLNDDDRVFPGGSVHNFNGNNQDGFTVDDTSRVRINFATSSKYNGHKLDTGDHDRYEERGHMFSENDWKNCEFTVYVKPKLIASETTKKNNDITLGLRTGMHDKGERFKGCEGFSYKVRINGKKKKCQFRKEQWHPSGYTNQPKTWGPSIGNIIDRWIGMKLIVYNVDNDKNVKMELWLDNENSNTFEKKLEYKDEGGWKNRDANEQSGERCHGKEDQIGTWGGPWALLRWDGPQIKFKNVSVRELKVPPVPL